MEREVFDKEDSSDDNEDNEQLHHENVVLENCIEGNF